MFLALFFLCVQIKAEPTLWGHVYEYDKKSHVSIYFNI